MKNPIEEKALARFAELMIEKISTIQQDWKQPWFSEGSLAWPKNLQGREYNGMNALGLIMHCEKNGWKLPYFCTFDKVASLNFKKRADGTRTPSTDADGNRLPPVSIMKGEKSFPVFITSYTVIHKETKEKIKYEDYKQLSQEERKAYNLFPKMQVYNVFNVAQTNLREARPELYEKLEAECTGARPFERAKEQFTFPAMDRIIGQGKWVCPIREVKGDSCYYSVSKDEIVLVPREYFKDGESFYGTCWHEMAHSTGAEGRTGRLKPGSANDSRSYGVEELVAELTAALTAQRYGLPKVIKTDSVPYLKSWLGSLHEEPEFIKTVLMDVKRAASMLTKCIDEEMDNDDGPGGGEPPTESDKLNEQYTSIKDKHPDAVILFRTCDFYESYNEDAEVCSEALGITLTRLSDSRKTRMTAFPFHKLDTYLPKLIRAGHRVAIYDQVR